MTIMTALPLRHGANRRAMLPMLLFLVLFWSLFRLPVTALAAQDSPAANELKQQAQKAYVAGRYDVAAALNLEIAKKFPGSEARRYSVQVLGTLYEDNLVDLKKAISWDR